MKTIIAVVLIVAVCTVVVADFRQIEVETDLVGCENIQLLYCWGEGEVTGSAYAQAYSGGGYQQLHVGANYHPTSWLTIGVAVGADTAGFRRVGSLFANQDRWQLALIHKDGESGSWHKDTITYCVSDRLTVGYIDQSFCGRGATTHIRLNNNTSLNYSLFDRGAQLLSVARSF